MLADIAFEESYDGSMGIVIPMDVVSDDNTLSLRFEFPDARVPGDGTTDSRILAIAFREMILDMT